ncbi:ATP-binding protein [Campylobacter sp. RKI_CA19_01128]|uniref:ATP-binding protein n=1 Tax=unclassified Campylobacter TaxID=2593542 RepID=UPI0021E73BB4|nr:MULTISPECIES: ATP-binding protein [unclassified Campylobacter]MCV3348294.1 ATP-binding protein [Campylobacter sp. RKI_CA19_01127]MCV3354447.1 ATP-binding protein [Campylobacter sp. RKI_CA19_01128]HEC1775842.1 ATP-binding protein [Campylobacter lari]
MRGENNMELEINKYKGIDKQSIILKDNKSILLVGENGCGKSRILESIFEKYIAKMNIICFSSGQNEKFTKIFKKHKKESMKNDYENDYAVVHSFYFDKNWIILLVFFSISTKQNSLVKNFLTEKNINIDNINLSFKFRILSDYIQRVKNELEQEEKGIVKRIIRDTIDYKILEKMAEKIFDQYYHKDFNSNPYPIIKQSTNFSINKANDIFGKDSSEIFTFLSNATNNDKHIDINTVELSFGNFKFDDLSDGEYQLLAIYAILDIFDKENTLFLFDEVDSHIHYKNIEKLWSRLEDIKGYCISTSHITESIVRKNIEDIYLVDNGKLQSKDIFNELCKRLDNFTSNKMYQYQIASKCENIVLVEHVNDWEIFKMLCEIKIDNKEDLKILDQIQPFNCSSDYKDVNYALGNSKTAWYEKYTKIMHKQPSKTKNIFMICDKDNYPMQNIKDNLEPKDNNLPQLKRSGSTEALLKVWKRREIENYLLSYTMLEKYNVLNLINNDNLAKNDHIKKDDNLDNINSLKELDCKNIIQGLYSDDNGDDINKMRQVIFSIPKEEISEDIVTMFNFLKSKVKK